MAETKKFPKLLEMKPKIYIDEASADKIVIRGRMITCEWQGDGLYVWSRKKH